jgi:hypothetical protein
MYFGVNHTLDKLSQAFDRSIGKQTPFAVSLALNAVANKAKENLRAEMLSVFDRPTSWTLNSLFVKPSKKTDLTARVGHKDQVPRGNPAGNYLKAEIEGGNRELTPFERLLGSQIGSSGALVPTGKAGRDRFGGTPKRVRDSIVEYAEGKNRGDPKGVFVVPVGAKSHLAPGVYQRMPVKTKTRNSALAGGRVAIGGGSALKTLMLFKPGVNYKRKYDLMGTVENTIKTEWAQAFGQAMDRALSTAKLNVR